MMSKFNYFIAGGLSLSLGLGGAATAEQNVCDMKILNRPGCEVGDFPLSHRSENHEIQIIYERPIIRDFREAPTAPRMIQLPPPPRTNQTPGIGDADDESAEMKIAWDEWHKRVADAIFKQFSLLANAAFAYSKPLSAVAIYTVTRDGRIINAHLVEENSNPIFNAIVLAAINHSFNSKSSNEILQFPAGSHREQVQRSQTFEHNDGGPFRGIGDWGPYPQKLRGHEEWE